MAGLDDGTIRPYYGIYYEGKLWLVTAWIVNPDTQEATPERMIRVDSLEPRPTKCEPGHNFDYVNILLSKAVIEWDDPDIPNIEVRNLPRKPVVDRRDLKPLPLIHS